MILERRTSVPAGRHLWRRVNMYDAFIDGAKEGFGVAMQIIPYLIAILLCPGCSRCRLHGCAARGYAGAGVAALGWNADFLPALPVGLMKVLSGAGARGLMIDVLQTHGVDSFVGRLAATSSRARPNYFPACWPCTSAAWA